jgi:hypothetical protein
MGFGWDGGKLGGTSKVGLAVIGGGKWDSLGTFDSSLSFISHLKEFYDRCSTDDFVNA